MYIYIYMDGNTYMCALRGSLVHDKMCLIRNAHEASKIALFFRRLCFHLELS